VSKRQMWDDRYAANELVWSAEPNALFADLVRGLEVGCALDVACGEGRNGLWLAELGWQVTGVDFSSVAISKAAKIAKHRGLEIDWIAHNIATDGVNFELFDLVAVLFLHTGFAEREHWMRRVVSAVKPGGVFVYIGHDPQNIGRGVGGPQDARYLPSADEVREYLDDFSVLRAECVTRVVARESGHGGAHSDTALDTLVFAVRKNP
jgi:SAM-dependent methyltransferase